VSNQLLHLCNFCTGFAPDLGRPVVVLHRGKDGRALAGPRQPTAGSIQKLFCLRKAETAANCGNCQATASFRSSRSFRVSAVEEELQPCRSEGAKHGHY
jgi:hypothetical protein